MCTAKGRSERAGLPGKHGIPQRPTVTRGFNRATVVGPSPLTRSRSSVVRNPPSVSRRARIREARVDPTPGSASSCLRLALFRSITTGAGDGRSGRLAAWRAPPPGRTDHSMKGAIRANVEGPIPGTARRSSAPRSPPTSSLCRIIPRAVAGPTPGKRSSCSSVAVLGSSVSPVERGRLRRASSLLRRWLSARIESASEAFRAPYGADCAGSR